MLPPVATVLAEPMIGAIIGGLVFGYYSDRGGRRRAMITAMVCAVAMVTFFGPEAHGVSFRKKAH